jgi:hypothetical protein
MSDPKDYNKSGRGTRRWHHQHRRNRRLAARKRWEKFLQGEEPVVELGTSPVLAAVALAFWIALAVLFLLSLASCSTPGDPKCCCAPAMCWPALLPRPQDPDAGPETAR